MKTKRRGAAIAVIVLLLAAVQMVAIGGLAGSVDEADQGVRRVLMVRARYAADGAGLIMVVQARRGLVLPQVGDSWQIGSATATVVSAPTAPSGGEAVVEAQADSAQGRRRVVLVAGGA